MLLAKISDDINRRVGRYLNNDIVKEIWVYEDSGQTVLSFKISATLDTTTMAEVSTRYCRAFEDLNQYVIHVLDKTNSYFPKGDDYLIYTYDKGFYLL